MTIQPCGQTVSDPPDRRLAALVLAAGAGRRFGGTKLTAPWRGGVLLDGALAAAVAAPAIEVVVVTGSDPAVAPAARRFASGRSGGPPLRVAEARDWGAGLSASLRAGLAALSADIEGAFVFLGDMPEIPHALAGRLADRLGPGVDAVQPVYQGRPGHPVLLGRGLFAAARTRTGDQGAGPLLAQATVIRVETDDPGVVADIDTRDAFDRLDRR